MDICPKNMGHGHRFNKPFGSTTKCQWCGMVESEYRETQARDALHSDTIQQQAERIRELDDKIKWFEREQAAWREFTEKAGNTVERAEQQLSEVVEYATKLRAALQASVAGMTVHPHSALALPLPKAMQGQHA